MKTKQKRNEYEYVTAANEGKKNSIEIRNKEDFFVFYHTSYFSDEINHYFDGRTIKVKKIQVAELKFEPRLQKTFTYIF